MRTHLDESSTVRHGTRPVAQCCAAILTSASSCLCQPPLLGETGQLVWGQSSGSSYWPAIIKEGQGIRGLGGFVRVEWYGQKTTSLVSL